MVYAGYAPAKLPTDLTPLQKALKAVEEMQTYAPSLKYIFIISTVSQGIFADARALSCRLDVIAKLVYNVACCPTEEKYKSIKLTNKKIHQYVVKTDGAMEVMRQLGWEEVDEELKCTKNLTMAQARDYCSAYVVPT